MEFGPQQLGKWLISAGIIIALLGGVVMILGRTGLLKLPGDFEFGSKNWRIYIPIAKLYSNFDCPDRYFMAY